MSHHKRNLYHIGANDKEPVERETFTIVFHQRMNMRKNQIGKGELVSHTYDECFFFIAGCY